MRRYLAAAWCLATAALVVTPAWAKRAPAKFVEPVVHNGVKYSAPNTDGRRGVVEACDDQTGKMIWKAVVYTVKIDPNLEEDVQWVFITTLEVDGDSLRVTNEKGVQYLLDRETGKAKKAEKPKADQ